VIKTSLPYHLINIPCILPSINPFKLKFVTLKSNLITLTILYVPSPFVAVQHLHDNLSQGAPFGPGLPLVLANNLPAQALIRAAPLLSVIVWHFALVSILLMITIDFPIRMCNAFPP